MTNDIAVQFKDNIRVLVEAGKLEEAKMLLGEYRKVDEDDIEIYSIMGAIAMMEGDMEGAEEYLLDGLALDNQDSDINYNLGYLYQNKNDYFNSVIHYNTALRGFKDSFKINELQKIINEVKNQRFTKKDLQELDQYGQILKKKIKVVIFSQASISWLSVESVWKAFKQDERSDIEIVQLPWYATNYLEDRQIELEYLIERGIQFKYWYEYNLQIEKPDVCIFLSPYDSTRPPEYSMENVRKIVGKIIYIPYALSIIGGFSIGHSFGLPIFPKTWRIFERSRGARDMFKLYSNYNPKNVIITGHPKMDCIYNLSSVEISKKNKDTIGGKKVILWNPHHSVSQNKVEGMTMSTFMEMKDTILDLFNDRCDIILIIRPHPLLFGRIMGAFPQEGDRIIREFLERANSMKNVILDFNENYLESLKMSTALLSDPSSLIIDYFATQKPIMYINKNNSRGWNEEGLKLIKYLYKGETKEDINEFINMIANSCDPMKEERISQINKFFYKLDGKAGYRIKEHIIEEVYKER